MGHIIADYPSRDQVLAAIDTMVQAGVRIIEIQIPFSEPMADGPVFMLANHQAVALGVGYKEAMALMGEVSGKHPQVDFVFMTYLNIVFKQGYEEFAKAAAAAGARGLIVPDLPVECSEELDQACKSHGLDNIRLIAPNTTDARMGKILKEASGLVYVVARTGVTGASSEFTKPIYDLLERVRQHTKVPLAVGFGVKSSEHVEQLKGHADFAIVGTRAFEVLRDEGIQGSKAFWDELAKGARQA
jgi:tryptophan synthase alpha chain